MAEISNETVAKIGRVLADVDLALDRLRSGSYRACETCGEDIDTVALAQDPLLTTCVAHPKLSEVDAQ